MRIFDRTTINFIDVRVNVWTYKYLYFSANLQDKLLFFRLFFLCMANFLFLVQKIFERETENALFLSRTETLLAKANMNTFAADKLKGINTTKQFILFSGLCSLRCVCNLPSIQYLLPIFTVTHNAFFNRPLVSDSNQTFLL